MFTILLLGLAAVTETEPIIVADDRPTISIDVARYDLRAAGDLRRLEAKIHEAAKTVCVRGYGVAAYLERVACVKSAIGDANRQLDQVLATNGPASPLAATAISISSH